MSTYRTSLDGVVADGAPRPQARSAMPSLARLSRRHVLLALVLLGAALRLWQWAAEGSLWLDEIVLSRRNKWIIL
jgi:hypothetical protein